MRDFVRNHPEYSQDSFVTERIQYDLLKQVHDINKIPKDAEKCLMNLLKFNVDAWTTQTDFYWSSELIPCN